MGESEPGHAGGPALSRSSQVDESRNRAVTGCQATKPLLPGAANLVTETINYRTVLGALCRGVKFAVVSKLDRQLNPALVAKLRGM